MLEQLRLERHKYSELVIRRQGDRVRRVYDRRSRRHRLKGKRHIHGRPEPPWEPGNIFSYPANFDQLKAHFPDVNLLTNDTTGFLTDGSTITQTATWTGSGQESDSTGLEQNYSLENDFSVNGATEFAGIGAEGGYGLDVSGGFGFNNL